MVNCYQDLIGKRLIGLRKIEHTSFDSASDDSISSEIRLLHYQTYLIIRV